MGHQLFTVFIEEISGDMQTEINSKQEVNFKTIHFGHQHSANFSIICIVVICIVKKFGGQENGGDDNSVNVQVGKKKITSLNEAININERQNKTFIRARTVLVDTVGEGQ